MLQWVKTKGKLGKQEKKEVDKDAIDDDFWMLLNASLLAFFAYLSWGGYLVIRCGPRAGNRHIPTQVDDGQASHLAGDYCGIDLLLLAVNRQLTASVVVAGSLETCTHTRAQVDYRFICSLK